MNRTIPVAPSWALEISVIAFVILLAISMPDLLDWIASWPLFRGSL